jgi:hypothetical protein
MPQGISNHPIDQMYRAQKNIQKGNDSCFKGVSDEGRAGAVAGAIIGAGVGAPIPPGGVFALITAPIGALIGFIIGELSNNDKRK